MYTLYFYQSLLYHVLKNGIALQMSASAILINERRINFLHSSRESYDQFQNVKITQPI